MISILLLFCLGAVSGLLIGLMSRWRDRMRDGSYWPFGRRKTLGELAKLEQSEIVCPHCEGHIGADRDRQGTVQSCAICCRSFRVPPEHDPWHTTGAAWVVMIVALFFMAWPAWEAWEERTIQSEGVDALAKVVEKLPATGRRKGLPWNPYRVRVDFLTPGGRRLEAMRVDERLFTKLKAGTHVSIRYLKKDPSRLLIHGTADDMPAEWYSFFFGMFAAGLTGRIWCFKRDLAAKIQREPPLAWRA
jgi:hypothetical protein